MAAAPLTAVAGVRLPGTSRVRFCAAETPGIDLHAWVLIDGPVGPEGGLVVVAPQQVVQAHLTTGLPPILRRLTPDEVATVAALSERARQALDHAITQVREQALPCFVTGLRYTLDGCAAIATYRGAEDDAAALSEVLEDAAGTPIHLVWDGPLSPANQTLFGGLGRLRPEPPDLMTLVRERFDLPGGPAVFAPEGLPRLGTRVETPQGAGTLRSVSTKHGTAVVRLDDGQDVTVLVDALRPAGS